MLHLFRQAVSASVFGKPRGFGCYAGWLFTLTTAHVILVGGFSQPASAQPLPVCGNGELEEGEDCDDGNTNPGDCCSATCQYEPWGSACGDPGDTVCDDPDTCDGAGTCQPNYEPPTTPCRETARVCDAVEYCDGESATCPLDLPANGSPCPDGDLCNGDEICIGWVCAPGAPLVCDNDLFCDGLETCDAGEGCVPGDPPCWGDYVVCNEASDSCVHQPPVPALAPLSRGLAAALFALVAAVWLVRRRAP